MLEFCGSVSIKGFYIIFLSSLGRAPENALRQTSVVILSIGLIPKSSNEAIQTDFSPGFIKLTLR
jgi:hypothetical protein